MSISGKSELGRRLASIGGGGLFFERLLTKYSNPEELFGPLSLSALERDEYVRNTDVRDTHVIKNFFAYKNISYKFFFENIFIEFSSYR